MSLNNLNANGERISYVDLREEFNQSSDPAKHELNFVDLTSDLHKRELLCMNNDELLEDQIGAGVFNCEYCDYKCSRAEDLKRHIPIHFQVIGEDIKNYGSEESAEQKMHVCEECGVIFIFSKTKKNQIQIQIYKDDSEESCEECNNRLIKVGDISKGLKKPIAKKIHTCPYCELTYPSSEDLDAHMEQHDVDEELLQLDARAENAKNASHDLNDSGFLENVMIKQEKKSLVKQEKKSLVKQEKKSIVKQEKQYSALSEGNHTIHFKKKKNIKKEYQFKSDAKFRPFACPHCTFRAVVEDTLKKHIKTHSVERKFECPLCDYKGSSALALRNHLKIHSDEKPHECSQCQYRTNMIANLRRHERQHTGEKPYACTECDYRGSQKIALQNHMTTRHS